MRRARLLPLLAPALLSGCGGIQSALDPRGPQAEAVATMAWVFFIGATVIFLVVFAMAWAGMAWPGRFNRVRPYGLLFAGVGFTTAVLLVLVVYTTAVGARLSSVGDEEDPLVIEVTGFMWWWEVRYPDTPYGTVVTANEVHIPVGRPVKFLLRSADVIHSWWIPTLHGKRDLIPGRTNTITMTASEPGVLRGQCAEFCGAQHALMSFYVVAHAGDGFDRWLAGQAAPAAEPITPELRRGADAFLAAGCGACHVVRGLADPPLAAVGQLGPDLTHVGSRLSIAAGTLPNGVGPLAGWIADAQHVKPGNRMPSFDRLDGDVLTAIARYLHSLE